MTISIQPSPHPADVDTNTPEQTTWQGIDGAVYDAQLQRHPVSGLAYYIITRNGDECGAILAESLTRTVRVGYKLPMPVPSTSATNSTRRTTIATHAQRTPQAPQPKVSQFRELKQALLERKSQ